ncbi:MAG: hypothetical protein H0X16_10105 [Chloroflexi bacterium]|nr:hypothetical protein [Chloroflexota bacterium]
MSAGEPVDRQPPFDFVVEEVTKEDGRYLLYYSWPERAAEDDGRVGGTGAEPAHPGPSTGGHPHAAAASDV